MPKTALQGIQHSTSYVPAIFLSRNLRLQMVDLLEMPAIGCSVPMEVVCAVWAALCMSVHVADLAGSQDGLEQRGPQRATKKGKL
jgi:hypothetical protein